MPCLVNFILEDADNFYIIGYHRPINMFQYFEVKLVIYKFREVDRSII
jgi:hypothetical protein